MKKKNKVLIKKKIYFQEQDFKINGVRFSQLDNNMNQIYIISL